MKFFVTVKKLKILRKVIIETTEMEENLTILTSIQSPTMIRKSSNDKDQRIPIENNPETINNNENSTRKRGRQIKVVDSDDDSDYSDESKSPYSTRSNTPRSQGSYPPTDETILLTPPKRHKSVPVIISTEEKINIPLTPMNNSNLKKISIWKRFESSLLFLSFFTHLSSTLIRYFGDATLIDHPCPCCCQTIDIKKLNFEVRSFKLLLILIIVYSFHSRSHSLSLFSNF